MTPKTSLKLALPKGHMQQAVINLLRDAGIQVGIRERGYRPKISLPGFEAKLLKPQNIVEMLHLGSRDLGFAGADWIREMNADVCELLDCELDPVRVVAAAPTSLLKDGKLPDRPLVVASEYQNLTKKWIEQKKLQATFMHAYGATEVFPPEDADCIVDNTATASTLKANNLQIVDEIMTSSTRLYANHKVLEDPDKKEAIERLILLLESVLESRKRVMLEVNVTAACLEDVISVLPCMREPTISTLHSNSGYAVKAAVLKSQLVEVIPEIKAKGGTDIIVTNIAQIVP
jgi:ATP phosphoribosyltransferase